MNRGLEIAEGVLLGFLLGFFNMFSFFSSVSSGQRSIDGSSMITALVLFFIQMVFFSVILIYLHDLFQSGFFSFQNKLKKRSGKAIVYILLLAGFIALFKSALAGGFKIGEIIKAIAVFFFHLPAFLLNPLLLISLVSFWLFYFFLAWCFVYIGIAAKTVVFIPLLGLIVFYLFHLAVFILLAGLIHSGQELNLIYLIFIFLLIVAIKRTVSYFDSN